MFKLLFYLITVPINWWKDIFLVLVLIACVLLAGLAVRERKNSQVKIDKLMALMKRAEDELAELQQKMLVEIQACNISYLLWYCVVSYDHIWTGAFIKLTIIVNKNTVVGLIVSEALSRLQSEPQGFL